MGRRREYGSDAERQKAYRERLAAKGGTGGGKGVQVPAKLVKVLGMLGSDHAGERAAAGLQATRILKEAGLTWYDVLNVKPE